MIHLPVALFWHECRVCACHAASHWILVCCMVVVVWSRHLEGGVGVVIADVVPEAVAIIVVGISMIRVH